MTWKPLTFVAVALAGWMNRQQQDVIEFLRTENRILREQLGHKRIILNVSQERRLATAAMKVGKDLLPTVRHALLAGNAAQVAPLAGVVQVRQDWRRSFLPEKTCVFTLLW